MIVTCSNCSSSLQIDETKAATDRFTIRCPKCQTAIPVQINSAAAKPAAPAPTANWEAPPAAAFQKQTTAPETEANPESNSELLTALAALIKPNANAAPPERRELSRVLMCLNAERNNPAAALLDDAGFQVFLADNPAQVTERIRDEEADIVIFSPDFALKYSGASVLQIMINGLAANERRKIFVVSVEESSQTLNTHEAFLRNMNLIVNTNDLHHLPSILNRALRDYSELYKHFNQAVGALAH